MLFNLLSVLVFVISLVSPADAASHGHARQVSPRTMFNIGTFGQFDYAFINFLQEGDLFLGHNGSNWAASGTCFWNTNFLDSNGWPNQACANGLVFGGGIRYPSSAQFSGQYTVDGSGLGVFAIGIGGTFTLSSGVQCGGVASGTAPNTTGSGWGYSSAGSTITTNDTAGTGFCVPFTNVGQAAPALGNFNVLNTCSTTSGACVGAFIKNVRIYQQRDFARLNAGNIFRSEYLQPIANLDPSYIRFMDWGPGDGYSGEVRYENRPKVITAGGATGSYWLSSPPYTVSTGTNLVSVPAVAGTPGSMVHGEVATFKFANNMNFGTRFGPAAIAAVSNTSPGQVTLYVGAGSATISAGGTGFGASVTGTITWSGSGCTDNPVLNVTTNGSGVITTVNSVADPGQCNPLPGVATTWTAVAMGGLSAGTGASFTLVVQAAQFSSGDVIIHTMTGTNMPNLHHYPVCVTVVDAAHYTMQVFTVATNTCTATAVNTVSFGSFIAGGDSAVEYASLNVGARLNAPITVADGATPLIQFFVSHSGGYAQNITYDKNSCAITNGAGANICGAWLVNQQLGLQNCSGCIGGFPPLTPIEDIVEYINEVNALLTGGQHPIGLWINLPHMGLLPTDPDYTTASDYPLNMAKTIVNYPLCAGCPVIFEVGNEWWNPPYATDQYFNRQNFLRYGMSETSHFGTLRTVQMFEDIHNNSGVYNPAIFHFAMIGGPPGFPGTGDPTMAGQGNNIRIFGDTLLLTDPRWPNANSKPYAYFDFGGWAPYAEASVAFYTANFTTLSANWCAGQAAACALTPPYAPNCTAGAIDTTYCLPFVNGIFGPVSAEQMTVTDLRAIDVLFKQALYSVGKTYVNYEGGANWATCATIDNCPGGNSANPLGAVPPNVNTAAQRNYMIALYQSTSWAQVWTSFCQGRMNDTSAGGCGNLSEITQPVFNFRFAYSSPDAFGSTTTEGNGLIPLWASQTTLNTGQP